MEMLQLFYASGILEGIYKTFRVLYDINKKQKQKAKKSKKKKLLFSKMKYLKC